jgi:hypothetical protein
MHLFFNVVVYNTMLIVKEVGAYTDYESKRLIKDSVSALTVVISKMLYQSF